MKTSLNQLEHKINIKKEKIRVRLTEEIALKWNSSNIQYAVVNGLYEYPRRIGRDIDVVINQDQVFEALKIIEEVGKINGFINFTRWSYYGLYQSVLLKIEDNDILSLPIDLLCTDYVWRCKFINLTESKEILSSPLSYKGPFKESEYGKCLKNIIRPFLCGDIMRFKGKYKVPIKITEPLVLHKLLLLFGRRGLKIIESVFENQYNVIEAYASSIKRKLQLLYFVKHFSEFVKCVYRMLFTRVMLLIKNRPVYIAIFSDDDIYNYLVHLKEWFLKGFINVNFVWIPQHICIKRKSLFNSIKNKIYHSWRNVIKDNLIPISEVRIVIRFYKTKQIDIKSQVEIRKIRSQIKSDAVIILSTTKLISYFFSKKGQDCIFEEAPLSLINKVKTAYLIGITIVRQLPKIVR